MKRFGLLFTSLFALVLLGQGCSAPAEDVAEEAVDLEDVKVGVMVPLSGDTASYGEAVSQGVRLAVKDLGIEDSVQLVFQDSKCEAKEAANAVNQLVNANKVVAIVGELCSGATLAAAPVVEQAQTPLVSPASTAPTVSDAGEYVFRTIPSDAAQGAFGAQLVYDKGFKKLAVLAIQDDYGTGFDSVLKESFPALGGEVVASEFFQRGDVDVRTQLTKIKNAGADALYIISNTPDSAVAALRQATELGLELALFGSEGLKGPDVIEGAKEAAEGLVVTAPSAASESFMQGFQEEFGAEPGTFSAQAYDAMTAIGKALIDGATTGDAIKNYFGELSFEGASGVIDFDDNGDVSGTYDVVTVENGEWVLVEDDGEAVEHDEEGHDDEEHDEEEHDDESDDADENEEDESEE